MSFEHKAYAFDWHSFSGEMLPWLPQALQRNDCAKFLSFIRSNVAACSDPYEGEPLARDWEETVNVNVVQTLTSLSVTPGNVTLADGATQQFTAAALDQFHKAMALPPNLTWQVNPGGGTISGIGRYFKATMRVGEDRSTSATLDLRSDLVDAGGALRLGAALYLVDVATGICSGLSVVDRGLWIVTTDLQLEFVAPVTTGPLRVEARVVRSGATTVVDHIRLFRNSPDVRWRYRVITK